MFNFTILFVFPLPRGEGANDRLAAISSSPAIIVGLDEAGRGPLAGPVVAGACVLTDALQRQRLVNDSKALDPEQREEAYAWILSHCQWGWGMAGHDVIDACGILEATERAMHAALAMLKEHVTPTYLIVDGRDRFWFDYPHSSVIRGDSSEKCIGAASIIAKVTRDRWMNDIAATYPQYGFGLHKGYGTPEHIAALHRHGPCPIHRLSFIKNIMRTASPAFGDH